MNETPIPASLDQAAFQRVWRRVMPQDRPDCPFTLEPPAGGLPASQRPIHTPAPLSRPEGPALCLGEGSRGELPGLEGFLTWAWDSARIYGAMARRRGRGQGLFAHLAQAKREQGKRLGAAYFLIAGERLLPPSAGGGPAGALPLAVRARYQAEQRAALELFTAANAAADPCLIELYRALATEDQDHAGRLRTWLEQGQ